MRKLAVVAVLASLVAGTASADDDKEEARQHFNAGVALIEAEDFAAAAVAFETAARLYPTRMVLFNLANCYWAVQRYAEALDTIVRLEREFGDKLDQELEEEVRVFRDRVENLVGRLEVVVEPAGATISVDGRRVGKSPLAEALVLGPGDYEVEASLEGYATGRKTVRVESRARGEVSIALAPDIGQPQPEPGVEVGSGGLPVLFWVGAGATVVAAGLGAGFWFAADARAEDFEGLNKRVASGEISPDDGKLLKARDDVELYDKVSVGMWIGAGVLAAATAAVLIVHLASGEDEATTAGVSLVPAPGGLAVRF